MATLKDYALTTVADVKESLGIPGANTQYDNLIIRKINAATAAIEKYCSRRFKATDYTDESYNGSRGNQLVLNNYPIIGDITLKARDSALNEADFETLDTEIYFIGANSGVIDLLFSSGRRWGAFAVSYRGGYEEIPDDLAEACAQLAAYYVKNSGSDVGVASKREGGRQINYASATISFQRILENLGIDDTINAYASTAAFADK